MNASSGSSAASLAWKWGIVTAALVSALVNLWAMSNWRPALDPAVAGSLGVELGPRDDQQQRVIKRFDEGSPVERAGARVGDRVRFDRYADTDFLRPLGTDERIGFTLYNASGARHLDVQPMVDRGFEPVERFLSWITGWAMRLLALGVVLVLALRRSDSPAMRGLMLALLGLNVFGSYFLPGGEIHDFVAANLIPVASVLSNVGFLHFALRWAGGDATLWSRVAVRRGFWALALVFVAGASFDIAANNALVSAVFEQALRGGVDWGYPLRLLLRILALAALVWTWRQATGQERERIAWVTFSMGASWIIAVLFDIVLTFGLQVPHIFLLWDTTTFLSYCGLAYAIVRHRVFDIGFAVNRALVFSIVSAIVLVAFGVTEWGVKKLLVLAGSQSNLAIDAAIALTVFLVFHRIHHWVGHRVNHTFFRHWEEAAERLRAFVARAPHVTDAVELRAKLLAAVAAFGGPGVGAAFYGRDAAGGDYRRDAVLDLTAPDRIDADDDAVVEMRRVHRAVNLADLDTPSSVRGHALALPMTLRGQLVGFVLLGSKPQQELYRPDEVSLLGASVQSVGLDLEALRVEALERTNAALAGDAATLRLRLEASELRLALRGAGTLAP